MTGPLGRVLVCGLGVSGAAAARVLLARGDTVLLADAGRPAARAELEAAGAAWLGDVTTCPDDVDLVVTSPGWRPDSPLLVSAARAGVEVIGEPELAWRLRLPLADGEPAPWYAVTGTNGKTTTVTMLEALLLAGGRRAVAAGNVGRPLVEVVTAVDADGAPAFDAVAVELSSFQLHWSSSITPAAAAVLNIADDHVDWHGSATAYRDAKARILTGAAVAVADAADPVASALVAASPHPVTVTLEEPGPEQFGVVDGVLVDRALGGGDLLPVAELQVTGPHNVTNALAAAALARAAGVRADDIGTGLAGFRGGAHRTVLVATVGGVAWVDDSKATNPHAAAASLTAYPRVVWVAGGLLKGADVDPLVAAVAPRLAGVVLLGRDRAVLESSLVRHAPAVPRIVVPSGDDVGVAGVTNGTAEAVMGEVVRAAAELARPGDTVLLAPAAASMDVFTDYAHRGRAFADAVRALP